MEPIFMKMLENGELSLSLLIGVFLVWFIRSFWPGHVERMKLKVEAEASHRQLSLEMEERLRNKEIESHKQTQMLIVAELAHVKTSIDSMHATFNDFLQNLLSQYMDERKELVDTGLFKKKGVT